MSDMAEMSMNKVIHGAVRRDLDRFVDALETFRPGDNERAQGLVRAWDNFDHQLVDHHEGEHEIAWPALEALAVPRATIEQMDAEHAAMAAALEQARVLMHRLPTEPVREETLAALERLREVTVTHLDHEEREMEPVYLAKQDTPEVKEMGKKFARRSGPVQGGVFFAWVLDGCSPAERAALQESLPRPVLMILTGLFGRSYRRHIAPVWAG